MCRGLGDRSILFTKENIVKQKRTSGSWALAALSVVAAGALMITTMSGCGGGGDGAKELVAGGSTFIDPMMREWARIYDKEKGVKVDYKGGGSGKGIAQMTEKTYAFGCTDAPMNEEELKVAKEKGGDVIHIPLLIGSVAPAYNLKDVKDPIKFSGPVLAKIYLGKITKWDDEELKKLNPQLDLPSKEIKVVHRSEPSGTTFIWTSYLSAVSPEWAKIGAAKEVKWPTGEGAKGTDGVANQVSASDGSIGYIEVLYALDKNIQFGSVRNQADKDIKPDDLAGLTAAADGMLKEIPENLCFTLVNAPGEKSYPICGVVWAVLYVEQPANRKQTLVDFLHWATHEGQKEVEAKHYAMLPEGLVKLGDKKLESVKAAK
jgi:phosphate ABC transporter phosphate-binding protein